jgi:hypothetical protein
MKPPISNQKSSSSSGGVSGRQSPIATSTSQIMTSAIAAVKGHLRRRTAWLAHTTLLVDPAHVAD